MTHRRSTGMSTLTLSMLGIAATFVGCSGPADNGYGFGPDDSGALGSSTGSSSGSFADAGGAQGDGRAGGSSSGSSGSNSGSGSVGSTGSSSGTGSSNGGSGSSSGSGSGSGGSGSSGSGGHTDASASQDAGAPTDATMTPDTASAGDAGLCDNASDWLTPMNQARMAVNAGEPPLVCDPIAAQVALNYANKCTWGHNANRNSDYTALGGTGQLGEDIAEGPGLTAAQAVNLWVGEQQYYDHATNTCSAPANQSCGHYTQIVWKTTTAVGCALVTCTTGSPSGGGTWQYAVCDFNPPGNYVGQPPY